MIANRMAGRIIYISTMNTARTYVEIPHVANYITGQVLDVDGGLILGL
jgi:hypothetical protein